MKKILTLTVLALFSILSFQACKKDNDKIYKAERQLNLPAITSNYSDFHIPERANSFGFTPIDNTDITDEGATLGRVLFYDTKLSVSNELACAGCHFQEKGFSDPVALSQGVINNETPRNSQTIVNCITQQTFFWDSRIQDLNEMVLEPIKNHNELGFEKTADLVKKLRNIDYYPALFEKAFGTPEISEERLASALAQFLRSMFSSNSKFDNVLDTEDTNILNSAELRGMTVFMEKANCNGCHGGFDLRGSWGDDWANIGLDEEYKDNGMGSPSINGNFIGQNGVFKVPSLRNIAVTAPYMHDGRFATLREVINHYNEGIADHPNLDWRLKGNNGPIKMNLSEQEINDLIAFLGTFTDHQFLNDPRFSDPFEQ